MVVCSECGVRSYRTEVRPADSYFICWAAQWQADVALRLLLRQRDFGLYQKPPKRQHPQLWVLSP